MAYIDKSKTDDWRTPSKIYKKFMNLGYFDPCPYKSSFDGLVIEWKERNFVNPPYSKLKEWVNKAIEENKKGKEVILLIPARTDTKTFRTIWEYGADIHFITGRLKFNDANSAPFPSLAIQLTGGHTFTFLARREDLEE